MKEIENVRNSLEKIEKVFSEVLACRAAIDRLPAEIEQAMEAVSSVDLGDPKADIAVALESRLKTAPHVLGKIQAKLVGLLPRFRSEIREMRLALISAGEAELDANIHAAEAFLRRNAPRRISSEESIRECAALFVRSLNPDNVRFPRRAGNAVSNCPLFGAWQQPILNSDPAVAESLAEKLIQLAKKHLRVADDWEKRGGRFSEPLSFK